MSYANAMQILNDARDQGEVMVKTIAFKTGQTPRMVQWKLDGTYKIGIEELPGWLKSLPPAIGSRFLQELLEGSGYGVCLDSAKLHELADVDRDGDVDREDVCQLVVVATGELQQGSASEVYRSISDGRFDRNESLDVQRQLTQLSITTNAAIYAAQQAVR
jgi:hypothetical protein